MHVTTHDVAPPGEVQFRRKPRFTVPDIVTAFAANGGKRKRSFAAVRPARRLRFRCQSPHSCRCPSGRNKQMRIRLNPAAPMSTGVVLPVALIVPE